MQNDSLFSGIKVLMDISYVAGMLPMQFKHWSVTPAEYLLATNALLRTLFPKSQIWPKPGRVVRTWHSTSAHRSKSCWKA